MDVKGFGLSLIRNVAGSGIVGLGYSAYYKLDKRVVIPFFVSATIVGVCLPYLSGVAQALENAAEMLKSRPTAIEFAKKVVLFAGGMTVCTAIQTIIGRQLGIYGTKFTILAAMVSVLTIGVAAWFYLLAKNASEERLINISRKIQDRSQPVRI